MRYPNHEVARCFVYGYGKTDAESYSQHYYCENGTLYSYSTKIAIWGWKLNQLYGQKIFESVSEPVQIPANTIFLTEHRYSVTTGCHEGHLRYNGYHNRTRIIEVPCEIETLINNPPETYEKIWQTKQEYELKLQKARKEHMKEHWDKQIKNTDHLIELLKPVLLLYALKYPDSKLPVSIPDNWLVKCG